MSAPLRAPPAADTASAIRAPGARVTRPGLLTSPTTLTTTGWSGAALERGLADDTISTGGSLADITGAGSSRIRLNTVMSTAIAAITASAMPPARPGSARIADSSRSRRWGRLVGNPARRQVLVIRVVVVPAGGGPGQPG